ARSIGGIEGAIEPDTTREKKIGSPRNLPADRITSTAIEAYSRIEEGEPIAYTKNQLKIMSTG
ncbi:MAG: hypothetical protein ACO2O0_01230, partial [Desulfurococcales archaeon]